MLLWSYLKKLKNNTKKDQTNFDNLTQLQNKDQEYFGEYKNVQHTTM